MQPGLKKARKASHFSKRLLSAIYQRFKALKSLGSLSTVCEIRNQEPCSICKGFRRK